MSADSVVSIAWDVLKSYVVVPVKRRFGYVISSKSFADRLREGVQNLETKAERVHIDAEVARNNNRRFYCEFTEWEARTEEALKVAREQLGDFEKASKTCCYGTLPDPKCRYQFSKKAEAKIEDIKQLAQKCSEFKGLNDISFSDPTPGNVAAPNLTRREGKDLVQLTAETASASSSLTPIKPRDDGLFESRASMIQDIMDALANNNNSVVGVYGLGGVGKSTLVAYAERRIREEKSFDLVAKAELLENPDIKMIQGLIAHALGLDMKDNEYESMRANHLRERLEKEERKILIILDNLWKGLDLKLVGIPCGDDNKAIGCKLLLTSRNRDVLRKEMGCNNPFRLDGLQKEEAKELFQTIVGDKVHDEDFKPWVDEALHKCAGLPFLILAIAKRFKCTGLSMWKDTLKQIEMFKDEEINEKINKILQLSYDDLNLEAKLLLRLCVVYGISKPSLENLVRYCVGLELFQEVTSMEQARDRFCSLIHALQDFSFLLDNEDANVLKMNKIRTIQAPYLLLGNEDTDGFKIHDLVREFVTLVASRDDPLLVLKDKDKWTTQLSKDKLKSYTAICFPYIDVKELPEELYCPKLCIFLLFTNSKFHKVPDSYFNSMRKLMVLNLTMIHLTRSFRFLETLRTLCLDNCLLEDVSIIGELKGLQILSFVNSKIHRLPKEIGQLEDLRLLDLNHCSQLRIIEPGVLGSLNKLEELYMENSFDQWNAVEQTPPTNASLIELNNMNNLNTLHVSIPDPSVLPEDLNVQKLTKYLIRIGDARDWSSHYKGSRILQLKLNPESDILHKKCIRTTLDKTDDLLLDGFKGTEQSICELSPEGFPKLKHLHIKNSPSFYYILQWRYPTAFKNLESLVLEKLINLEKICHSHIFSKSFSTLKVIRAKRCDKMKFLFPLSLLRELPQLEEIGVDTCNLMRKIVEADDCGKVKLCNLQVLELRNLPDIKNFFTLGTAPSSSTSNDQVETQVEFFNGQQVSIPCLESLTMIKIPNLQYMWSDESPLGLSNLQSLLVGWCESLSKVINSGSLLKLQKLRTLTISYCDSVQEIFDLDRPSTSGNVETDSKLTSFKLERLRSLRRIWNKNPCGIVKFHSLERLTVGDCDNIKFLFFPSMVQSLTNLRSIYVNNCKKMETIIMEEEGLEVELCRTPTFLMLSNLSLHNLESLTCFSRGKYSRETRSQDCVNSCSAALFDQEVAFPSLETLDIAGMDNIKMIWDNQVAADSFHKLKSLSVYECHKLVNIVPSCILERLYSLESLVANGCSSLEVVFNLQPLNPLDGRAVARSPLKNLELYKLSKLQCVWDKEVHRQVKFQCLHYVCVLWCERLTSLFPASVANDLIQLEELEICQCGIEEIIEKERPCVPKFVFPNLTSLKLRDLTELKCIYTETHALRWQALKTLEVRGCDKVKILASQLENEMPLHKQSLFLIEKGTFPNLQKLKLDLSERMEIWNGHLHDEELFCKLRDLELYHISKEASISTWNFIQRLPNLEKLDVCESYLEEPSINVEALEGPGHELKVILPLSRSFQHLKTLNVTRCYGLSYMFTPTIARNLVELTNLKISKCRMLTEVISDEGGKEGPTVAFEQLKYVELNGLTGLRCFSSGGYILEFPLLEDVIVTGCLNMQLFSEGPIEAPKLERVQVSKVIDGFGQTSTAACSWKGNLNYTIQNLFEEMVTLVGVRNMRLSEFPDLIGKWHSELIPIKSPWQLRSLEVDKSPSFINAIPSRLMLVLDNLSTLRVRDCNSLEEIFDSKGLEAVESTPLLPTLHDLHLFNLPKLRQLWNKDLHGASLFNSLSQVSLYNCSNLRHVFAPSTARCLANLFSLEIKECVHMERVIAEEEGQGTAEEEFIFRHLHWMKLTCLPNLTNFLSGKNHMLYCPRLDSLSIVHCPKMRSFTWQSSMEIDDGTSSLFSPQVQFPRLQSMVLSHMDNLRKIWTDGPRETLTFECLQKLEVYNCNSLENLFPYWLAITLRQLEKLQVESSGLEEIVKRGDDTPHSTTAQLLFRNLTSLVLQDMPQLKSFCASLPTFSWPFLKELRVTHCDMLSFAISLNNRAQRGYQHDISDHSVHFSFVRDIATLERLLLVDKDIQRMEHGKFPDDIFGKPKALTLACFHDKKAVFPTRLLLERFQNLQSLEIFCSSFEDIFPDVGLVDKGKHLVLENLRELKLSKLHNLKHVWRKDYLVSKILQNIKTFNICDCPSLTTLFPAMTSLQNLTKLVVENSSGLVHLVTFSAVTNLVHLNEMTIIGCESMKEVVANDGNREGKVIFFGKLKRLRLQHLPNLVCFSSITSCIFRFPSLRSIEVEECPKMKIFSKGTLSTPELYSVTLGRWFQNWEGDLNTTIQKLSA